MRYPLAHKFLLWLGPTFAVFIGGCVGLIASLADPFPGVKVWAEQWYATLEPIVATPGVLLLVTLVLVGYIWALVWTGRPSISSNVASESRIAGSNAPALDPNEAIRREIERARLERERVDALAGLELRRGLDAYVRGEPRAPPPLPEIGTLGAAVFGIDSARTIVIVDIKNFGQGTALNVRYRAACGVFPHKPKLPDMFNNSGLLGRCEAGHTQNIQFHFDGALSSAEMATFRRDGGRSLYALLEVSYEDETGKQHLRPIGYYLDPLAVQSDDGRFMMSICEVQ